MPFNAFDASEFLSLRRIRRYENHTLDPGVDERLCTRRPSSDIRAGFKRDESRCAPGRFAGLCECGGFGVGRARACVEALPDDHFISHENATDAWIGVDERAERGECRRTVEHLLVLGAERHRFLRSSVMDVNRGDGERQETRTG